MHDVADVAPVATIATKDVRKPNKAALAYIQASGARAISIIADVDGAAITVGMKPDAIAVFWLPEAQAQVRSIAARARTIMGDNADTDAAISALQEAATACRATLTPNDVAMTRATNAAERLDAFMLSMRGTGTLKEFNKQFKLRRQAAFARGEGYMSYQNAELRLKRALIPILMAGGKATVGASLFATIFDT